MSITANIQQHIFDLLSKTSNVSFARGEIGEAGALGLTEGEHVVAEVVSLLPYGRAQVSIGNTRINLELQIPVRVGQNLEMTYVASDPRPTFAMARIGEASQPVRLSDASKLLSILLANQQTMGDPTVRSSLQSISQLLRQTDDAGLIATMMDEALTYSPKQLSSPQQGFLSPPITEGERKLFETNASQILQQLARNARFTTVEALNQPITPLPINPGDEVHASITGTLPGGRVFVEIAGVKLEFNISTPIPKDGIMRLTYLSPSPKPTFALANIQNSRSPDGLSEAGRWLSVLEHSEGGVSNQQMSVLQKLNLVISALPPDSPAFTAIRDEAITYDGTLKKGSPEATNMAASLQTNFQNSAVSGNGIVLHDDMAKLLQALIKGNRLALLEAINQQSIQSGLTPGQQVRSDVLAYLGGGRFMVDVAGKAMEFTLPKGVTVGNKLQLFFISNDPKPTFLLVRFGSSNDSNLSQTGRWIGTMLEQIQEKAPTNAAPIPLSIALDTQPLDSAHTAKILGESLKNSGLFYESHLARWFGDDYQFNELLKEPQATLSNQKGGASTQFENGVDPRTLHLVQEQLSTLQSGQMLFSGEIFQGYKLEWSITDRDKKKQNFSEEQRNFDTSLKIELPHLGEINTRLKLENGGVKIEISAAEASSAITLEKGKTQLIDALEAAGLNSQEIRIRHEA